MNAKIAREPPKILATSSSTLLRMSLLASNYVMCPLIISKGSLDEQAFQRQPVIGPLPDMINDDLPRNLEYLDASFGAAAGLRPFDDEDEEDEFFEVERGKDLQFHKIRIRPPEERPADDESDTESYVSEVIPDIDLDEIRKGYTDDGPRRSKRLNKPNK